MAGDGSRARVTDNPGTTEWAQEAGWGRATVSMHEQFNSSTPSIARLFVDVFDPVVIDFRTRQFSWTTSLSQFPANATDVSIEVTVVDPEAPSPIEGPGSDLKSLLWILGANAFGDEPAPWLGAKERYRLRQWPNLARHFHNMHQLHMIAILGNAHFSVAELADAARVTLPEAQRIINSLSLMNLLDTSTASAKKPAVPTAKPEGRGLFARLRARLGR